MPTNIKYSRDDGGVGDGGVGEKQGLQFGWRHLKTFVLDQLLQTIHYEQLLVVVDVPDISGVEPPVLVYRPRRCLRVVQVTFSNTNQQVSPSNAILHIYIDKHCKGVCMSLKIPTSSYMFLDIYIMHQIDEEGRVCRCTFHDLGTSNADLSWLIVRKGSPSLRVNYLHLCVPYHSPTGS